jgi:Na+/melibiose symporter-like transporter
MIDAEKMVRDGMKPVHVNAYSVGHYFNDLCACMWFVYLTWYLINIVHLSNNTAGLCVLSGQIADGICTPVTGLLSDKYNSRWGKRFPWYVVGSFIVFPCFMGIFSYPPFVNKKTDGIITNESF